MCQFAIVPSHQRRGLGKALLQAIYSKAIEDGAREVNIEDPSSSFRALRDHVDLDRALALEELPVEVDSLRRQLLLPTEQAQRLMEIMRLRSVDEADWAAVRAFRVDCKKRLLKKHEEILAPMADAERKRKLADLYEETTEAYRCALRHLSS